MKLEIQILRVYDSQGVVGDIWLCLREILRSVGKFHIDPI